MEQKTVTHQEHYVLIDYYQSKIKDLQSKLDCVNAKLEVLNTNNILT
jgi:hypothetical protein